MESLGIGGVGLFLLVVLLMLLSGGFGIAMTRALVGLPVLALLNFFPLPPWGEHLLLSIGVLSPSCQSPSSALF